MPQESHMAVQQAGIRLNQSPLPPSLTCAPIVVAIPDATILHTLSNLQFECASRPPLLVTSGSLPLPNAAAGCPLARFHTPFSFSSPWLDLDVVERAAVTLSGAPEAVSAGVQLAFRLGLTCVVAQDLDPMLYHAACVMAANIVPACLDAATQCLRAAGLPDSAHAIVLNSLLHRPLRDLPDSAGERTGPASRNDAETLVREALALRNRLPELEPLFRSGNTLIARLAGCPNVADALDDL